MRLIVTLALVFFIGELAAQDSTGVVVHKDPRIDLLVKKHIDYNELTTR